MKKYEVDWIKNYHMSGTVIVEATNITEAENKVAKMLGDLQGNLQYDDSEIPEITVLDVITNNKE